MHVACAAQSWLSVSCTYQPTISSCANTSELSESIHCKKCLLVCGQHDLSQRFQTTRFLCILSEQKLSASCYSCSDGCTHPSLVWRLWVARIQPLGTPALQLLLYLLAAVLLSSCRPAPCLLLLPCCCQQLRCVCRQQ
jgi:hypothetical protein